MLRTSGQQRCVPLLQESSLNIGAEKHRPSQLLCSSLRRFLDKLRRVLFKCIDLEELQTRLSQLVFLCGADSRFPDVALKRQHVSWLLTSRHRRGNPIGSSSGKIGRIDQSARDCDDSSSSLSWEPSVVSDQQRRAFAQARHQRCNAETSRCRKACTEN